MKGVLNKEPYCLQCGIKFTVKRKHYSLGVCYPCYERNRRAYKLKKFHEYKWRKSLLSAKPTTGPRKEVEEKIKRSHF